MNTADGLIVNQLSNTKYTREQLIVFLEKVAEYFTERPTGGEDMAHWANVYNAEKCLAAAEMLKSDLINSKHSLAEYKDYHLNAPDRD
jgi:hypothetical protein